MTILATHEDTGRKVLLQAPLRSVPQFPDPTVSTFVPTFMFFRYRRDGRKRRLAWVLATAALAIAVGPLFVSAAQSPASQPLMGEWILASSDRPGNPSGIGIRRKSFTDTTWSMVQKDPATGFVVFEHGGEYKLNGTSYTETVRHAGTSTANLIGQTFTYRVTVSGNSFSQVDGTWNETWRRATPAN
jgi:hypothetical protein